MLENDPWRKHIRPFLTIERAHEIRILRVEREMTWRQIAETCYDRWEIESYLSKVEQTTGWAVVPNNQLVGQALCYEAANMLNEDPSKSPWN